MTDRRAAVEAYSQSDAWKLLRFEWRRATAELADEIRQLEKDRAGSADSDRHVPTDPVQMDRLKRKIANLANAICHETKIDGPPDGSTDNAA